jgi:galactokinase
VLDCHTLGIESVPIPADVWVHVLFVAHRTLVGSPYADRVAQCAAAESFIGPLRLASPDSIDAIPDPIVRRRARHVITENARVRQFASAMGEGRFSDAGALMLEGHESLRLDYDTSTPAMDDAVRSASQRRGVYGARMTGGGFGGCIVALSEPGVKLPGAWVVRAAGGASLV